MAKRRSAPARPRRTPPASSLWLGCFSFDRTKRKSQGSFRIVVEATGPEEAFDRCYDRLLHLHETTTMFDEPIAIYTDGVIKLTGSFEEGLLVNWDEPMPNGRVGSLTPDVEDREVLAYTRGEEQETDPFIVFEDDTEPGPSVTN